MTFILFMFFLITQLTNMKIHDLLSGIDVVPYSADQQ